MAILGPRKRVTGMAVRDLSGCDAPALVVIGINLLEFKRVEIKPNRIGGTGLVSLHPVDELDAGDVVTAEVRDLPDHLVPLLVLQQEVVTTPPIEFILERGMFLRFSTPRPSIWF